MTKNILIVEDEVDIAELLGEVLKDSRFEINICNDGKAAKDFVTHSQPDLIIMDVILPQVSGIEVVSYINNELKKDIPILFVSSVPHISKILKDKKTKTCYFLEKPYDFKTLVDLVRYYFDHNTFENFKAGA